MDLCVSKIVFQRTEEACRHSRSSCLIRAEQFPESGITFLPGLTPTWSKHKYFSYSNFHDAAEENKKNPEV